MATYGHLLRFWESGRQHVIVGDTFQPRRGREDTAVQAEGMASAKAPRQVGRSVSQTSFMQQRRRGQGKQRRALPAPPVQAQASPTSAKSCQLCPTWRHLRSLPRSFRSGQPDPYHPAHSFLFSPKVVILTPVGKRSRRWSVGKGEPMGRRCLQA